MTDLREILLRDKTYPEYMIDWYRLGAEGLSEILWVTEFTNELDPVGFATLVNAQRYLADQIEHIHNRTGEFAA